MNILPSGTVTFLFTDIEGSTRLWEEHPEAMNAALTKHDELLRREIEAREGFVFKTVGDAFCAAFSDPRSALEAALAIQRRMESPMGELILRVRIALDTGVAEARDRDYFGQPLNRTARLLSAGHGGQTLVSAATAELLRSSLPVGTSLRDMGECNLKDLMRPLRIFQVEAPGLRLEFPKLKTLDVQRTNLLSQLTSFIGRKQEIEEIKKMTASSRLVTLVGAGGTGKTRLSLQTAAELLEEFPEGVWLIELGALTDAALIPQVLATTLGLREDGSRPIHETLINHLGAKKALLILDNCEHLIEASAQFAETLLRACPQLRILASSREKLGAEGETVYYVPPLTLPTRGREDSEAVLLFVERARAALPSFEATHANIPAIYQICTRLDGIPLALELAAARISIFSAEQIAARLDDSFRLLTGGSRTALPRQRTLRALIDWSWDLLREKERNLLSRLAVFVGGWTLEAAEQVCGTEEIEPDEIWEVLAELVNKSLVTVEREAGLETRYELLETIRQYGKERLVEGGHFESSKERHLSYFDKLVEKATEELHRHGQKEWLRRLETEHDNLRAALEWAIESRSEKAFRMSAGLADFWDIRGYFSEGRKWLMRALESTEGLPPAPVHADMLNQLSMLAIRQTDVSEYLRLVQKGLGLARAIKYPQGIAQGLAGLARFREYYEGENEEADELYAESLQIWRELGNKLRIGQALGPLAARALRKQKYSEAERIFNDSLTLFQEAGDQREIAGALWNLAEVALAQADDTRAEAFAEESLKIYRELEDKHGIATALRTAGEAMQSEAGADRLEELFVESCRIFRELNDTGCLSLTLAASGRAILAAGGVQAAHKMIEEGLRLVKESGETQAIASLLGGAAEALLVRAKWKESTWLFGAAEAYREAVDLALTAREQASYERSVKKLHDELDEEEIAQIWGEGRRMPGKEAIEFAIKHLQWEH